MDHKKVSIAFQTNKPISVYGELAAASEAYGFDGISVYNDLLYQPAWLPLMEIARHTSRVAIGVAAVNPFTSHPINIAGNISLIDEVSQGRAYLGLARGSWLDFIGVEPKKSIRALKEAFVCIRHLLRRNANPLESELFPLAGGDALRWPVYRSDIPFLLGSWGIKTIESCLDYIEEVKLGGSANADIVLWYRDRFTRLGTPDRPGIVMGAVTVVDGDRKAARELARREVALYLPVIAELDKTLEIEPEILSGIKACAQAYDFDLAAKYISDELLQRFALAGTPMDIVAQTQALFDAGATRVEYGTPHGLSLESGLKLLGEKVLPEFLKQR